MKVTLGAPVLRDDRTWTDVYPNQTHTLNLYPLKTDDDHRSKHHLSSRQFRCESCDDKIPLRCIRATLNAPQFDVVYFWIIQIDAHSISDHQHRIHSVSLLWQLRHNSFSLLENRRRVSSEECAAGRVNLINRYPFDFIAIAICLFWSCNFFLKWPSTAIEHIETGTRAHTTAHCKRKIYGPKTDEQKNMYE